MTSVLSGGTARKAFARAPWCIVAGHDAMPDDQAASIMFWTHRPASNAAPASSVTSAIAAAAVATWCANRPKVASSRRRERSRMTTKCQGWRFRLLPAMRPA